MADDLPRFIEERATSFEDVDAPSDLGTGVPIENEAFGELVTLPATATPLLTSAAERSSAKVAAHLVAVIGRRGDPAALPALKALEGRYEAAEPKSEWTHAVVAQTRLAIEALSKKIAP